MTEEQLHKRVENYPIPRPAQPDDIADAIVYLATGTSLTTGQCLVVDGGRTMCRGLTGVQGVPLVGSAEGQRPLARRRPSRREISEGVRVQARTPCRMPLTNPRGLQSERFDVRESSTPVPQNGRPLFTTVPHGSASGGKG